MIKNSSVYRKILFAVIAISGLSLLAACGGAGYTPPPPVVRSAILNGAQVFPTPNTGLVAPAAGLGGVVVDQTTKVITGGITSITSVTVTEAHIHIAAAGANGAIIITLEKVSNSVWNIPLGTKLLQSQYDALLADGLYFDVNPDATPAGQIRGQINIKP